MAIDHKPTIKAHKNNFALHVALIMRDNISKPDALILAYAEGASGLNTRLGSQPKG